MEQAHALYICLMLDKGGVPHSCARIYIYLMLGRRGGAHSCARKDIYLMLGRGGGGDPPQNEDCRAKPVGAHFLHAVEEVPPWKFNLHLIH